MTDFKTLPSKPTLGVGCWAIGGPFFNSEGTALGWGDVDDNVSIGAIHAALDHGVTHFDTAQAYGAGHSEEVLGTALSGRDVAIATKIGLELNPEEKLLVGPMTNPAAIRASLEGSLERLRRDHIDLVLLHLNQLEHDVADPIFEELDDMVAEGKVGAFGWSTDFPENALSQVNRQNFTSIEHAMNVFLPAPDIAEVARQHDLIALIRSPLAMGVLGGRYDANSQFGKDDIRNKGDASNTYFKDGRITEKALHQLDAVREILQSDGRSLAQGAISWLWAKSKNALPIPGVRTEEQANDLCGALEFGPLLQAQMAEIEEVLDRTGANEIREL